MRVRHPGWSAAIVAAAIGLAGCAKTKAATEPEMPALATPPPPPRLIAPLEVEAQPEPSVEPDETPAKRPRPSRPARPEAARPTESRTDTGKTDLTEPTRGEATPSDAAPLLRTQQPGDDAAQERNIRDLLSRASTDLAQVDYGALGVDARSQYDTAKRFIQQAYEALRSRNLVFAGNLADKAATLASVLVGR